MPGIAVFVQQRNVFDAEVLIGQNIQAQSGQAEYLFGGSRPV